MKKSLIITLTGILLFTIPGTIFSQDTITIYFNKKWVECKKNRATYYRKYYETEDNTYHVCDYNTSGQLQMTGTFQNKDWESKTGLFTYYYPNGQKKSETYYIENNENGVSTQWYDNGNKKDEVVYVDGKRNLRKLQYVIEIWTGQLILVLLIKTEVFNTSDESLAGWTITEMKPE